MAAAMRAREKAYGAEDIKQQSSLSRSRITEWYFSFKELTAEFGNDCDEPPSSPTDVVESSPAAAPYAKIDSGSFWS
jgi:hypothetical protein